MENTVQGMLDYAAKCKTEPDVIQLITALKLVFLDAPGLAWLTMANDEVYIEDGEPHVRFELNRVINGDYVTVIRPTIRRSKLSVQVLTKHMRDGLGLQGKSWDIADDLDDVIHPGVGMALDALALRAEQVAIGHHASLLEKLAIPREEAEYICTKNWKPAQSPSAT